MTSQTWVTRSVEMSLRILRMGGVNLFRDYTLMDPKVWKVGWTYNYLELREFNPCLNQVVDRQLTQAGPLPVRDKDFCAKSESVWTKPKRPSGWQKQTQVKTCQNHIILIMCLWLSTTLYPPKQSRTRNPRPTTLDKSIIAKEPTCNRNEENGATSDHHPATKWGRIECRASGGHIGFLGP